MLSEETIKQIFFLSDKPRSNALMADEVDIIQFAENLVAFVTVEIARKEHKRCVKIVTDMNSEVGRALDNQRP